MYNSKHLKKWARSLDNTSNHDTIIIIYPNIPLTQIDKEELGAVSSTTLEYATERLAIFILCSRLSTCNSLVQNNFQNNVV